MRYAYYTLECHGLCLRPVVELFHSIGDMVWTTSIQQKGMTLACWYSYGFEGVEGYIFNVPAPGTWCRCVSS
jgi:hypothetical protein